MTTKAEQLQIRISTRQKAGLRRQARAAGLDLSSYVMSRALPPPDRRFDGLIRALADAEDHRFALAALSDLLDSCPPIAFQSIVTHAEATQRVVATLSLFLQNYLAAMVEHAAFRKDVRPPHWVREVAPLAEPWFATSLRSVRQHLLVASPVAFKRRNLFIDATIGDRA